jgi:hypothetical protein
VRCGLCVKEFMSLSEKVRAILLISRLGEGIG